MRDGGLERAAAVSKPVVLTVEDDAAVRAAFHMLLDDEYVIVEATDGRTALAALSARPVDVVLLDIRMPGDDGIQVLRDLRRLDQTLAVIMVTGVKTVTTAVEAMKLGALDYVTKPFDAEAMRLAVRRAVERRRTPGPHVQRALEYLRAHYARPVSVNAVARAVGLSGSHLAHLFRAETGMTVRQHLLKTRVEAARERLTGGDEKLAEVARQVGFCDASHLTRAFVRLTGRRPGSFRSRAR
jgi:YesN/AraC family two-component response regulator